MNTLTPESLHFGQVGLARLEAERDLVLAKATSDQDREEITARYTRLIEKREQDLERLRAALDAQQNKANQPRRGLRR